MFNRNARNRLNTMGGIASFQNGGPTRNPQLYFQPSQQGLANRGLALKASQQGFGALSPLQQMALKSELTMQGGRKAFPIEGMFSSKLGDSPAGSFVSGMEKGAGALRDIITTGSGIVGGGIESLFTGEPGSKGLAGQLGSQKPTFNQMKQLGFGTTPPKNYDDQIMRSAREIALRPESIIEKDTDIELKKGKEPFYKDKIVRDLEKEIERTREPEGTGGVDANEEFAIDDRKKIIKSTEEQQKTTDDKVVPKPTTKEDVEKLINTGSPEEQQSELKQLMSEFKQNAPEYEGMDKNLALAKVFFSIAAGKDPDAITNIADGLNKGADMFLKDKKERDAFNRQVDLAALRYGLQERSKDRAQKFFIADQEVTVDGKKYAKGDVVSLTTGFIRKNGIPSGLTTETLTKAAMDNAASIKKALNKLQEDKKISLKDFNTASKRVDDAALSFTKSRNLQTLIQGQIFNVSEGNVTGLAPAGRALVKKAFNAAQIKGGLDKKYTSIEEYNTDMQKVANTLIQEILGEGSKNLSNVDRQLAQEIVGLYTTGAGGITGYVFQSDEILLRRLQGIHDRVVETQRKSLSEIEDVLAATNGLTFQSGAPVKFAKVRDLGLYGKPQGTTTDKGAKTQTIKLGDLLSDGKFDKDKFNKLLIG